MPLENILYATSRVAVLSVKLFNTEKFDRMINSENLEQALKVLQEASFGDNFNKDDFKAMLNGELSVLVNFIKQVDIDSNLNECLLSTYDYLNAKMLLKAKYLRLNDYELNDLGLISNTHIKQILTDDYAELPEAMKFACEAVDTEFANNKRSPMLIDSLLDRAMYSQILGSAKKFGNKELYNYFVSKIDCINTLTFLRVKNFSMSAESFQLMFINGGSIPCDILVKLLDKTTEEVVSGLQEYFVKQMLIECSTDLVKCEAWVNKYIKNIIVSFKNEAFTCLPLVNYFFAKQAEIDNIRLILVCIKNNVEKAQIYQRLRELYV